MKYEIEFGLKNDRKESTRANLKLSMPELVALCWKILLFLVFVLPYNLSHLEKTNFSFSLQALKKEDWFLFPEMHLFLFRAWAHPK